MTTAGGDDTSSGRVLYIGLDACDASTFQHLAAHGHCPNIAALLATGAVQPTIAPYGTFVGSSWMTITTGLDVGHHRFWNWLEVDPDTYALHGTTPRDAGGIPFWEQLAAAGRRVAVLDVPHMDVPEDGSGFNGVALKEWGAHDRHDGTASYPPSLLAELDRTVGRHPIGCGNHPAGLPAFAPCDYTLRDRPLRSLDEERHLLDQLRHGIELKRRAVLQVWEREPWDVFAVVLGEGHCAGHQFWHLHDPSHPRHDPAAARLLGDPVIDVYMRLDAVVGDLVARAGDDTTVYVQLNHGMGPHYDGDHLLDALLARIDAALAGGFAPGRLSRLAGAALSRTPARLRPRAQRWAATGLRAKAQRGAPQQAERPGPGADRRFFPVYGNTSVGAVRFNVAGRESRGTVRAGADYERLREQLAAALAEVIDIDSGRPLVRRVVAAEEVYERTPGDRLPDLFVEWNRTSLVERAWSPLTGTVAARYDHWRTGDHHDRGLLLARGRGIAPGPRDTPMALVDTAPTVAAAAGVVLAGIDGVAHADLVPEHVARRGAGGPGVAAAPRPPRHALQPEQRPDAPPHTLDPGTEAALDMAAAGLAAAHAAEARLREQFHDLNHRFVMADRERQVWNTMAWLAAEPVRDDVLVSVITPTYRRPDGLAEAIASVQAQRHRRWEMVIVDDGSDTAHDVVAAIGDERLRVIDADHGGACAARNVGLEHVRGDVVTFLDDDNWMHPEWLHAVAWAFANHPEASVLYGARLIDDEIRVYGIGRGGFPWLQFNPFDRHTLEQYNFADMGVIAHRAGLPARFDTSLVECGDWDYFLSLTQDTTPLELPAVALYYRTEGNDRITGKRPDDADRVRAKWAETRRLRAAPPR